MTYIQATHNRAVTYVEKPNNASVITAVLHWVAASDREYRRAQQRVEDTAVHF